MKREILFKAKDSKGAWHFGNLIQDGRDEYFIQKSTGEGGFKEWYKVAINPETVCQFTGLLDKNGNKILN